MSMSILGGWYKSFKYEYRDLTLLPSDFDDISTFLRPRDRPLWVSAHAVYRNNVIRYWLIALCGCYGFYMVLLRESDCRSVPLASYEYEFNLTTLRKRQASAPLDY